MSYFAKLAATAVVLIGLTFATITATSRWVERENEARVQACVDFGELHGVPTRYNPRLGCEADAGDGNWLPVSAW